MFKVAFYTEAGTKRGMGHLIRSYAIYETFKEYNIHVNFYLDSDIDYTYKFKDIQYFTWEHFQINHSVDVIFIDSYEAPQSIYEILSQNSKLLVSIDDYGRLKYPKGVILNFAPNSNELFYKTKKDGYTYLLGLDFIPIRKGFLEVQSKKQKQIFIMLGGNDTANLSETILKSINTIRFHKVLIINDQKTAEKLKKFDNVTILYQPKDEELISTMSTSSFAISTASMTIYELAYFNIPTLILALNKNQQIGASQLLEHHLASDFIDISNPQWKLNIISKVNSLLTSKKYKKKQIIDGKGTLRVFHNIKKVLNK